MISVSTSWKSHEIADGARLLDSIVDVGAEGIELEYRINAETFEAMKPRLATGEMPVTSVHNYFPVPDIASANRGSGDALFFSSDDEDERKLAIEYGIRSLAVASELGASVVVFHLGKAPMPNGTDQLKDYFDLAKIDSGEARAYRNNLLETRRRLAPRAVDRVLLCLDKLVKAAGEYGVVVGVENRFHPSEIPDFEEIGRILSTFAGGPVGYWHDVGHAVVQERFGIYSQSRLLEAYGSRMAGIHYHDVVGYDDHWAPGTGEVDFGEIAPYVPAGAVRVIEVHSKVSREELVLGLEHIRKMGLG